MSLVFMMSLIASACTTSPTSPTLAPSPAPSHTPPPTDTPLPTLTATPAPSDTPAPTATPDFRLESLRSLAASEYWPGLGLPGDVRSSWQAFLDGKGELTAQEMGQLDSFLAQWEFWRVMLEKVKIPSYEQLALRLRQVEQGSGNAYILYAIDEKASTKEGSERIYLLPHPEPYELKGLVLAPKVEGLSQRISQDGAFVEYVDGEGEVLLTADAFTSMSSSDSTMAGYLKRYYAGSYGMNKMFPSFHFPGVEAGLFVLDKNLTLNQIILLKDTVSLFDRPELAELKPYILGEDRKYLFVKNLEEAAGMESGGNVLLSRKDLFGDKVLLAGVISHEAAHTLQGARGGCKAEIGNGVIPSEFYSWSAEDLIKAVKVGTAGAEHMELWVFNKLGASQDYIRWSQDLIKSQGRLGWDYCQ